LRSVPSHCVRRVVSGSLKHDGRRIRLPPKDLEVLTPALGCIASAEGMTNVYRRVLASAEWVQKCAANAGPVKPDRPYPLYSCGLTHFLCDRSGLEILGHVGIYNGCTGATLHHPGLGMTASLLLDRIDLESSVNGEYRMIFAERFLLELFQLINDKITEEENATKNVDAVIAKLSG